MAFSVRFPLIERGLRDHLSSMDGWILSISGALFGWFLVFGAFGAAQRWYARPNRVVRRLADSSYWIYLIHFPIQLTAVIAVDALGLERSVFNTPLAVVAYFVVSIGGGLLIYHLFEMPAQRWLRSLAPGRGTRLTPVPAE